MHLRALKEKDAEGMLEWMQDPAVLKGFGEAMSHKTREDVLSFISAAGTDVVHGESVHYAIANEKDEYLGTISLKNIDLLSKTAEYAISLRSCAHGKGIGTQATREILRIAFEKLHLQRVYLNVFSDNAGAIRLYEKSGFVYEGALRRHLFIRGEYKSFLLYGMLDDEYFEKYGMRRNEK